MKSWKISLVFACTRMCIQRRCVKKGLGSARSKKRPGRLFSCLLLFGRSKRSNVAVKGEIPTKSQNQTPQSESLRITDAVFRFLIVYTPSRAEHQQRKLNQTLKAIAYE